VVVLARNPHDQIIPVVAADRAEGVELTVSGAEESLAPQTEAPRVLGEEAKDGKTEDLPNQVTLRAVLKVVTAAAQIVQPLNRPHLHQNPVLPAIVLRRGKSWSEIDFYSL